MRSGKNLPIDSVTGMPEVPPGYYWEVKVEDELYEYDTHPRVGVSLYETVYTRNGRPKRHGRYLDGVRFNLFEWVNFGPGKDEWVNFGPGGDERVKDGVDYPKTAQEFLVRCIRWSAQKVYKKHQKTLELEELKKLAKAMTGQYPPKRLPG